MLTTFLVHESFLTTRSEFFKRAMNGRWIESATRTISLVDDDPHTFALYLNHIYKNELSTMAKSKEELHALPSSQFSKHIHEEYMALFRLYVLAEKLQDVSARNEVIATIFWLAFIDRPNENVLIPRCSVVLLVYNGTPRGSFARSLVVDLWSGFPMYNLEQVGPSLPKDFILDLAVAFSGMLSTKRQHPAKRKGVGAYLETAKSSLNQEATPSQHQASHRQSNTAGHVQK
ncbi:hypothetical protein N0V94_008765 [Neodidymelliopsis sp. IMI 364377]|nr:hypothetical protein N0V94_008765 [Neodidymelliopsis sp. IMI 364377]